MLSTGIKKELMFFTRSFKLAGVIIAAIALAVASPLMMKLSAAMIGSLDMIEEDSQSGFGEGVSIAASLYDFGTNNVYREDMLELDPDDLMSVFNEDNLAPLGILSSFGDTTGTLLLIIMIVTMYSAGGELKKRSRIIPQNAGLSTKLYVLPKFLIYPLAAAILAFVSMLAAGGTTALIFGDVYRVDLGELALTALIAAIYDGFIVTLYFTLGLCTARAGIATIILYGGSAILSTLFTAFGADKFHPFALKNEAQNILLGEGADMVNIWGSIGVTVLLMLLCYFVTVFVISAKKVNNRGKEEIEL